MGVFLCDRFHVRDTGTWGTISRAYQPSYRHHWRSFMGGTGENLGIEEYDPNEAEVATIHRDNFFSRHGWNVTDFENEDKYRSHGNFVPEHG